jgi:hypothetical protein
MAPVARRLISVRGSMNFHPNDISWSYRGRGMAARRRIKKQIKANDLIKNQINGGRNAGPSHPPKKIVAIMHEIRISPRYSPTINMPNFMPEYSV